jgi:hypothetical protein
MDEDYYYDASNYDWTSGPDDPVYENYPLDYRDYNDASNYDWTSGPDDPVYENYPLDYRDFWESGPDEDYALDYRDYTNNQSNNYADYTAPLDWTTGPDQLGQDVAGGNISSSYAEFVEEQKNNPTVTNFLSNAVGKLGDGASSFLKKYLYDPKTGKFNIAGIGTGMAALAALTGGDKPKSSAYQGEIPKLTAINQQIAYNDPNRRPALWVGSISRAINLLHQVRLGLLRLRLRRKLKVFWLHTNQRKRLQTRMLGSSEWHTKSPTLVTLPLFLPLLV